MSTRNPGCRTTGTGATGGRVTPKVLYYTALRVKWMQDQVTE